MTTGTYIITYQHPHGGVGCYALCLVTPNEIRHQWEFTAQCDAMEAVLHAMDNYPIDHGTKVSDMTFMKPSLFASLYRDVATSDAFYRCATLTGAPLRHWLADKGNYLHNVRPLYAIAQQCDKGTWEIKTDSITCNLMPQSDVSTEAKRVKITHRGIQEIVCLTGNGDDDNHVAISPVEM